MRDAQLVMLAHFEESGRSEDRRRSRRRALNLRVVGSPQSSGGTMVVIHDLSSTGLLLETSAALDLGSPVTIELPHAGRCSAKVVWNSGELFGCQFDAPISKAAVSAALLKSPAPGAGNEGLPSPAPASVDDEESAKLPLRTRFWIYIGLAALSASLIAGALALAL